ncbi:hypothetical protein BJY04DRAFT_34378 [Aspergillus karnatakaensis]|uniref:uncharacterized protein n=1 Tax=Aspergillus karnatakaensis TaxID=1810916 RepID=UPI003CCD1C48
MSQKATIHFFDILSVVPGPSKAWSPNTLKTRIILNFKGIPYTQTYVTYPDIAPLLNSLSVPPHAKGTAHTDYTLPAITTESGTIMDSLPIARHLEEQYPEKPIFPSGDASYALAVAVNKVMVAVGSAGYNYIIPAIVKILDPRGQEFFIRTRTVMFGKPLAEVAPTDKEEVRSMIEKMKKEAAPLVVMLKGKTGKTGPFIEGEKPGYADFIVVAFLIWFKYADENIWEEIVGLGDGEIRALWEAVYPWVEGQGEEKEWKIPK